MKKLFAFAMLIIIAMTAGLFEGLFINECAKLQEENKNLREILDSIDNPHHHDYLLTLRAYNEVKK